MKTIKLRSGFHLKTPVEMAYEEVERVRRLCGGDIDLQTLVDESAPVDALLHKEFEWRDDVAANKWRLHRGRKITQCFEVQIENKPPTRAYEAVFVPKESDESGAEARRVFRRIEDIMSDPVARDELLGQAIRDALAFKRRYGALQELAKVFAALDDFLLTAKVD